MKRILSILLAMAMIFALYACGDPGDTAKDPDPAPAGTEIPKKHLPIRESDDVEKDTEETKDDDVSNLEPLVEPMRYDLAMDFASRLTAYVESEVYHDLDYIISPVSLRAAMCLAIAGADGDTLDGLLKAADFQSESDAAEWLGRILASVDSFNEIAEMDDKFAADYGMTAPGRAFRLANAVWNNGDISVPFREDYIRTVTESYHAAAMESGRDTITDDVNAWCNDQTGGMIPSIASDLSNTPAILLNALYLKSAWTDTFSESNTYEGDFTCPGGPVTQVDYMTRTETMRYYDDGRSAWGILDLEGGKALMVRLRSDDGTWCDPWEFLQVYDKLSSRLVHLVIPKLDIESAFSGDILCGFLATMGAGDAFDPGKADFTRMADSEWFISDIAQKAKLKTDEEGLEAAAVTAIMMMDSMAMVDPEEPVDLILDRAFSFVILDTAIENGPEVLFAGQFTGIAG